MKNSDDHNVELIKVGGELVPGFKLQGLCEGYSLPIGLISWSPKGDMIASPLLDNTIRVWDINKEKPIAIIEDLTNEITCVAWSPDAYLLASTGRDKTIKLWDWNVKNKKRTYYLHGFENLIESFTNLIWASEQIIVATTPSSSMLYYVDLTKNMQIHAFDLRDVSGISSISMAKDLYTWAVGDINGDIHILQWQEKITRLKKLQGHRGCINSLIWFSNKRMLASCSDDNTIRIWDLKNDSVYIIEGHILPINSLSISCDNKILASKSEDNTVRFWLVDEQREIFKFTEFYGNKKSGLAFHPTSRKLATLGRKDTVIRLWDLNEFDFSNLEPSSKLVRYTSVKIVLVGESNAGKSCLAMRLAEKRYPRDDEHGTTHGMRFWPINAEDFHSTLKNSEDYRRDIVLWDMGGQDEYRLVHQLFLDNTTIALILIDPTRGRISIDEAKDWNKQLEKHLKGKSSIKILVGAKQDQASALTSQETIHKLCEELNLIGYIETSALTGRGIDDLRNLIVKSIDWDKVARTSRPVLFQIVRDYIEELRKNGKIVLLLEDLNRLIEEDYPELFEAKAIQTISSQLATQGSIAQTRLSSGDDALVLHLPIIEKYAGSLIIAARNNRNGLPALEERLLGSSRMPLPGINNIDRLDLVQEHVIIECIAELMIQNGICFRHEGLLIFPTLFPEISYDNLRKLTYSVSLYYDFTGAIDNIFASLVAKLMISGHFGEGRLWSGCVEFDELNHGICGIRQIKRSSGFAHLDLFFSEETMKDRRNLFTHFIEDHLRNSGVDIREHQAIKCRECDRQISEDIVQTNISAGEKDVVCPWCRTLTMISEGVGEILEKDPESSQKIFALRKIVEKATSDDIQKAKRTILNVIEFTAKPEETIRILHLSDLHFNSETSPKAKLQWLVQDIHKGECLGFDKIEYIVITGDLTDKGNEEGFEKAREFTSTLIETFSVSAERCIFVPGNHDIVDLESSYDWYPSEDKAKRAEADEGLWHREGNIILVRNKKRYHERIKRFSDAFYHKIKQKPYPLHHESQGIVQFFPETCIQFLSLNSCWQIDQFYRKRSGLHPESVANAIKEADNQKNEAIERNDIKRETKIVRFCAFHHSVNHPEMIKDTSAVENLHKADVTFILHGDIHEMNREIFKYWHKKNIHIIGAGSFASPAKSRPESIPRLYNIIELKRDLTSARVHTRRQINKDGPWEGWYEWNNPRENDSRLPYFDIILSK